MPDGTNRPGSRLEPETLADLIGSIAGDPALPDARRRVWAAALRRLARYLGKDPENLPASLSGLRYGVQRLNAATLQISPKSLSNLKSEVKAIFRHCGVLPPARRSDHLVPEWQILVDRLDDPSMRRGLSQFVRWASTNKVQPLEVDDAVVERFAAYLEVATFTRNLADLRRRLCRRWNRAANNVRGWPKTRLSIPDRRPVAATLPWSAFPQGLATDVEAYLEALQGRSVLAEDAPIRPCKQSTIDVRRRCLQIAASAAVAADVPAESLTSLANLVDPPVVKSLLEWKAQKQGRKPHTFVIDLAALLASIARHWAKLPEDELMQLRNYCLRLEQQRPKGLTDKNLAAVRTIKDPVNWRRLLALPEQLMQEALRADRRSTRAAVKAELAIAHQILLIAPMRIGNLATLTLVRHLIRVGGSSGVWHIHAPEDEVKNGVPLEYPITPEASHLIDLYLEKFRPRLAGAGSDWLFPGENNRPKLARTLSAQITDLVYKRLGIRITAHQYRHGAAAVLLEQDPGNYELVRRFLGHKRMATTVNFYVGLETAAAVRRGAELLYRHGMDNGNRT